eukprot:CAMPEP_0197853028 /NCGR_PEP_ID=MMETSP1438-20131217/21947_1 /TAXON_ID=1461541 /ORGANISM="Pterosperma sp., Strain CCMP1384" /LENGTH=366 /DNA_ID=CAMNT_0043467291 /DNA_START=370 /DNA_END=1470 /DNA_ORIENTATION=-
MNSYERALPMPEELPAVDQPLITPVLAGSFGISDSVYLQPNTRDPAGHSYFPAGARPEYTHSSPQMYRPPMTQEPPPHPGLPNQHYAPYPYDPSLRMSHVPYPPQHPQHPQQPPPQHPQQHPSMSTLQHPGPYPPYNPTGGPEREGVLAHVPPGHQPPPHMVAPHPSTHMGHVPPMPYHNPMDGRDPYAPQHRYPGVMDPQEKDGPKGHKRPGEELEHGRPEMEQARALKRPRLVWTPQLHKRFVDAVSHLGIKNSVPKTIMQLMNVEGLTRENVASHLQKYRLYLKRLGKGDGSGGEDGSEQELAETQSNQEGTSGAVGGSTAQSPAGGEWGSSSNGGTTKATGKKSTKGSKDTKSTPVGTTTTT